MVGDTMYKWESNHLIFEREISVLFRNVPERQFIINAELCFMLDYSLTFFFGVLTNLKMGSLHYCNHSSS